MSESHPYTRTVFCTVRQLFPVMSCCIYRCVLFTRVQFFAAENAAPRAGGEEEEEDGGGHGPARRPGRRLRAQTSISFPRFGGDGLSVAQLL